jgi:sulfate transport system ATP-binding protein
MSIDIRNITKTFGAFTALDRVNLTVLTGSLVALLGPSGSGKTTLLRIISGLEAPDQGEVLFYGESVTSRAARERRVGFVFQHYALFRHMSVFDNVAFGLQVKPRAQRPSKAEIAGRVHELLALVRLDGLAGRFPWQLSGGQRQRVALARALAVKPKMLLLDEPFGSLDAMVRQELRRWLRRLHDEIGITSVFVTHDQEEALEVADRVVVMHQGRVEQAGTPEEIYEHPATPFVYQFLGRVNLFHGRVHEGHAQIGAIAIDSPEHARVQDAAAVAYVRPHDLEIARQNPDGSSIEAVVKHINPVGPLVRLELDRCDNGQALTVELQRELYQRLSLKVGERVYVTARKARIFVTDYSI